VPIIKQISPWNSIIDCRRSGCDSWQRRGSLVSLTQFSRTSTSSTVNKWSARQVVASQTTCLTSFSSALQLDSYARATGRIVSTSIAIGQTFASRAFRNAALVVWNDLPHHLTDDLSWSDYVMRTTSIGEALNRIMLCYVMSCLFSSQRKNTHLCSISFCHWLPWPVRNCDSSIYFWLAYVASPTA